ncbi:sulfatase [Oleiharenicola lentus]|nr:sulfatase [Oleiharenicola lentus]
MALFAANRPPNVVIIMADDMNDYGFLGAHPDALTPRLDAFRREALTFPRTYCPAPACVPSRAAFFTGLNPHRTGAYLNGSDPWDKPGFDRYESMPELFRRRGYATWGGGKVFHAKITEARRSAAWTVDAGANGGFGPHVLPADQIDGQWWGATSWTGPDSDFPDVRTLTQAREFLARHEDGKPFFMFVGLWRPHTPFTAPKRFFDLYDPARLRLPPAGWRHGDLDDVPPEGQRLAGVWGQRWTTSGVDHPEAWRRILHGYLACTSFADWAIGEVLDGLRQRADYANTLVIVTTDNGYHLGEKDHFEKSTLWEASARTPLAVRLPGGRHAGQISPRVIGLIDVLPTLAQLCELPAPGHAYDGRTLAPLLEDPSSAWPYPAFTAHRDRSAAWRDERWRYIRYPDDTEELYDHTVDPHEWHNLAPSPVHHEVLQRFRTLWPETWAPSLGGRDG